MIRALLVDDEDIARERLRQLLGSIADLEVVGEAADGEEAIQKTLELRPDLLLLDIQMPGLSGLEVAACLPRPRPKIVFCTAYDAYAVKAFELHAMDYLLKPVSPHRLALAIEKIRQREPHEAEEDVDRLTRALPAAGARLLARCGGATKSSRNAMSRISPPKAASPGCIPRTARTRSIRPSPISRSVWIRLYSSASPAP
jgi:DNA-binding LytR/AlgR family response regulator